MPHRLWWLGIDRTEVESFEGGGGRRVWMMVVASGHHIGASRWQSEEVRCGWSGGFLTPPTLDDGFQSRLGACLGGINL